MNKPKFKIGQKVFYIAEGYTTRNTIKAIFFRGDSFVYAFEGANYFEAKYSFKENQVQWETALYPSVKALIKSIEETEFDDE